MSWNRVGAALAAFLGAVSLAHGANKCVIDGRTTYQEAPCPSNAASSVVATPTGPMDPSRETTNQLIERWKKQANEIQAGQRKLDAAQKAVQPAPLQSPAPPGKSEAERRAEIDAKIAEGMRKSDEQLAKAKAACGGSELPTAPSIGMPEQRFRSCTVIGLLVEPDAVNVTETAAGTTKQFVYLRSIATTGFKFVYTRNGVVDAIQR
ncbi:hypothetical protein LJR039_004101 [Pseudorhodoferax sp. LjRoot39]|uniref:hypothetical protein n=1 Tax=Pseudorhodoferax sp. LjRoot39 TaxID=3342328 RepID=UPI003ED0AEBA